MKSMRVHQCVGDRLVPSDAVPMAFCADEQLAKCVQFAEKIVLKQKFAPKKT